MELTSKNYTRNDWRKLLSTRRGTIIVAGVCALVAAGILLLAMNRYRHNVDTSGQRTDFAKHRADHPSEGARQHPPTRPANLHEECSTIWFCLY